MSVIFAGIAASYAAMEGVYYFYRIAFWTQFQKQNDKSIRTNEDSGTGYLIKMKLYDDCIVIRKNRIMKVYMSISPDSHRPTIHNAMEGVERKENMQYKIYPLSAGENAEPFDMSVLIHRHPIGKEQGRLGNGFFAVQGEDGTWFLIDTGTGSNEELAQMGKPLLANAHTFLELLASRNINPEEIKTVILTHMHWDHTHNLDQLPNAKFYVQKGEITNAVSPGKHERSTYGFMGSPGFTTPRWMAVSDHMVTIEGEVELLPGVRCIPTPGHTPGSQSVLVDTAKGQFLLVGDQYYLMRNVEEDALIGVFENHTSWYASHEKVKNLVDLEHIITTHDIKTYKREFYG